MSRCACLKMHGIMEQAYQLSSTECVSEGARTGKLTLDDFSCWFEGMFNHIKKAHFLSPYLSLFDKFYMEIFGASIYL